MKAQELIHRLSAEYVDPDADVEFFAYDMDGKFTWYTIANVTATVGPDGISQITCDIEPSARNDLL